MAKKQNDGGMTEEVEADVPQLNFMSDATVEPMLAAPAAPAAPASGAMDHAPGGGKFVQKIGASYVVVDPEGSPIKGLKFDPSTGAIVPA